MLRRPRSSASPSKKHLAAYTAKPEEAKKAISYGESKPDEKLNPAELAAWTMAANLVMNLDEGGDERVIAPS
jgi:hypothetical protein